jgi:hypothetical protein
MEETCVRRRCSWRCRGPGIKARPRGGSSGEKGSSRSLRDGKSDKEKKRRMRSKRYEPRRGGLGPGQKKKWEERDGPPAKKKRAAA